MFASVAKAKAYVGGLSAPSKMPGNGYSLPAIHCQTGAKLAQVPGTTCHKCYALKGNYLYPNVQKSLQKRFELLKDPLWVEAMTKSLEGQTFFRWHDSGDLQGVWHLENIVKVAENTPEVKHWLPTREYKMVREFFRKGGKVPKNLCIRLSEHKLDQIGPAKKLAMTLKVTYSGVEDKESLEGYHCPALSQGNSCGDCRACWNPKVKGVIYHKH